MGKLILPDSALITGPEETLKLERRLLQSLFDFLGALANQEVGAALSRWQGMTNEIATRINKDLTLVYKHLWANGMRHRWRPVEGEPHSWRISRQRGWAETRATKSSLGETK